MLLANSSKDSSAKLWETQKRGLSHLVWLLGSSKRSTSSLKASSVYPCSRFRLNSLASSVLHSTWSYISMKSPVRAKRKFLQHSGVCCLIWHRSKVDSGIPWCNSCCLQLLLYLLRSDVALQTWTLREPSSPRSHLGKLVKSWFDSDQVLLYASFLLIFRHSSFKCTTL